MAFLMARPIKLAGSRFPYARKVVPADVRGILGRTEFKRPLRGETAAENRRLHAETLARWEAEIGAARAKLKGEARTLTLREIDAACGAWYRAEADRWADDPGKEQDWDQCHDDLMGEMDEADDPAEREFVPDRAWLAQADAVLRGQGFAADGASVRRAAVRLWQTKLSFAREMIRRCQGDWSPDANLATFPQAHAAPATAQPPAATAAQDVLTFAKLVEAWALERQPPQRTREKWDAAFAGLAAVIGHDDARSVTVENVRRWKQARFEAGKHSKTVTDGISVMRATFNWGIRNGLLPEKNPFAGMAPKINKRGPGARDGFTDAEAARILEAARKEEGFLRWLPWLLCFTGARINEVADARACDVREEAGTWILDIVPTAGRALKTDQAQRMVPLHPALIAEGLLEYVQGLPADGPLFPDLKPGRYDSRGETATKNHSRWMRGPKVGIADPRKAPAHSWRHRMEDQLRIARVPTEAQDAITGRDNPRNAGANYGRGFRGMPDQTLRELARVPSPFPLAPPTG